MSEVTTKVEARNGLIMVERWQDVQPYIEASRRTLANHSSHANGYVKPIKPIADVPNIVIEKWLREGFNPFDRNNAKELQRKLNSNEYSAFRLSPGRCKVT
jgi:hypothetical protein